MGFPSRKPLAEEVGEVNDIYPDSACGELEAEVTGAFETGVGAGVTSGGRGSATRGRVK